MSILAQQLLVHLMGEAAVGDWWDPDKEGLSVWGAWQAKGAASFAASLVDLTGNGHDLGDPGGAATPAWNAVDGWIFDTDDYLTTTFVPASDQSQSALVQFKNVSNARNHLLTAYEFGNGILQVTAQAQFNNFNVYYGNGNPATIVPPQHSAGNLGVAGDQGYRDGVADGDPLAAWANPITTAAYLACLNNAGAVQQIAIHVEMLAVVIYDVTLTADQMLAVATAMAAL